MHIHITGIGGFAASHLAEVLLKEENLSLSGSDLPEAGLANISHISKQIEYFPLDIRDFSATNEVLNNCKPDVIFHLAAASFVPSSPELVQSVNVQGSKNLLSAMTEQCPEAKGIFISSSEVYGILDPKLGPIDENHPIAPANPYAQSKVEMEALVSDFIDEQGLNLLILRPFNHIGPRQSPQFAISSFAKQIADIEAGGHAPFLTVGNLEARRDFTDVRDMVQAYLLAMKLGKPRGLFNLASNRSYSIKELLNRLLSLTDRNIEIRTNPDLMRPSDNPDIRGNAQAFSRLTSWKPEIPIEQTLNDILMYWRNHR